MTLTNRSKIIEEDFNSVEEDFNGVEEDSVCVVVIIVDVLVTTNVLRDKKTGTET